MTEMSVGYISMKPATWSYGMQSRAASRIGERPDVGGAVEAAFRAGMTEAIVFAKDHTGFCFYPTKTGFVHLRLKVDLTGGMTRELHRRGMKSIAYINLGMDGELGRRKPEWRHESAPGVFTDVKDHYVGMCIFSDCMEKYMLPLVAEVMTANHMDGVFFDPITTYDYCCCPACRKAFEAEFGKPLPLPDDPDNPLWAKYGPFQYRRIVDNMNRFRGEILKIDPKAVILFNHYGGPFYPMEFPGVLDGAISGDPRAAFPQITLFANYMSAMPYGGDIYIERFFHGWGDRCDLSDLSMEYKSASIFMYGQRWCVGDRMHPECRMAPGSTHAMQTIVRTWSEMKQYLPEKFKRTPDMLMLFPESQSGGKALREFGRIDFRKRYRFYAAYQLLVDAGRSVMAVPEMMLEKHLSADRLLVLASYEYLKPATEKRIRQFAADGGAVLVSDRLPVLDDDSIPEWLGIGNAEKKPCQPGIYLTPFEKNDADAELPLVRGNIHRIGPASAQVLLCATEQYDGTLMGAGFNSSAAGPGKLPLLTVNRYGKGKVYYLNAPLFSDYIDVSPQQKQWCEEMLRRIRPKPACRLDSPSGNVELASHEAADGRKFFILVNHGGRQALSFLNPDGERIVEPQPVFKVILHVACPEKQAVLLNGKKADSVWRAGEQRIPVAMDSVWKIVQLGPES